ncbi:anti-sigma F factor antagonist [Lutispora saccharofermentans]|uniref:Anti-sigma F factor antagonist n=1 Tax=Lutispora saccharofermentans TaxID=3024236 RepID=A0ABT1NID2_9FIRM|nr:anti-sigma F factor antagonist [Lutispora saccharofermentans]MCQ1530999.1 anti-sigma F factor antagonist [Lutispora saccharofermentans]
MQVNFETLNNILIIKLNGELDHHSSSYVRDEIDDEILAKNPKNILFDMSHLNFMDSSGIGVIIGRYKFIASNGGKVGIVSMKPQIKRIYEICGLKRIIPSFDNKKTAIEKL